MAHILQRYENRGGGGIAGGRLLLRKHIASHRQIFQAGCPPLRVVPAALNRIRNRLVLVIIFDNGIISSRIRCQTACGRHILAIPVGGAPECENQVLLTVQRRSVRVQLRISLRIQSRTVQAQHSRAFLVEHIFIFRIILADFQGGKIILHGEALDMACLQHVHIYVL